MTPEALPLVSSPNWPSSVRPHSSGNDLRLHSRLATVAAVTSGTSDDIVAKLDDACRPFGYLEEIQIDRSFEFTSPVFREWGAQHDAAIVFHPPRHWSRATEAVLKNL